MVPDNWERLIKVPDYFLDKGSWLKVILKYLWPMMSDILRFVHCMLTYNQLPRSYIGARWLDAVVSISVICLRIEWSSHSTTSQYFLLIFIYLPTCNSDYLAVKDPLEEVRLDHLWSICGRSPDPRRYGSIPCLTLCCAKHFAQQRYVPFNMYCNLLNELLSSSCDLPHSLCCQHFSGQATGYGGWGIFLTSLWGQF